MRRLLVRRLIRFPRPGLLRAHRGQFLSQLRELVGQLHDDLVLLRAVPLQMGVAFLQTGQSIGVTHPPDGSGLRHLTQSANIPG